jgi:PIN domain nuclease of toxin-antitoxin system
MRILLDTCTFLWAATDAPQLSRTAIEQISDPENSLFLSAASAWEIAVKYASGRLKLADVPRKYIPARRAIGGIAPLPIHENAALYAAQLPRHHKDPFDRILICQSIIHGLPILSPDPLLAQYPVRLLW